MLLTKNRNKTVKQHDSYDCGAACLCMVTQYYNRQFPLQYLRKATGTSQDGISLMGLVEGANKVGFEAYAYEATLKELVDTITGKTQPYIVHLRTNHFVVAYKIVKDKIYVNDPAQGKYSLKFEEFERIWSGYFVEFVPKRSIEYEEIKIEPSCSFINVLLKENVKWLCILGVASLIIIVITIICSYIVQVLLEFDVENNKDLFYGFLVLVTGAYILYSVIDFCRGWIVSVLTQRIDTKLIKDYSEKVYYSKLEDIMTRKTGDYIARMSDLVLVRRLVTEVIPALFLDFLLFAISGCILLIINSTLFAVAILITVIYVLMCAVMNTLFKSVYYETMQNNSEIHAIFMENLLGLESIKVNNLQEITITNFLKRYKKYTNSIFKANIYATISDSLALLIEQLGLVLILFIGFVFISKNILSLGFFASFYMVLSCFTAAIKDIVESQPTIYSGIAAIDRINDIHYLQEELENGKRIVSIDKIEIRNLSFAYLGKDPLIENLNITINSGDKLSIIGENGSGKTTVAKLLLGLNGNYKGDIKINGISLRDINLFEYRKKIMYVKQNDFILSDTIYNNLTLGYEDVDKELVIKTSIETGLDNWVKKFPRGYDTYINEAGSNLSLGQKQLIALTRGLIKKPEMIILDEATSNLDKKIEKNFISKIKEMDCICIVISHNDDVINKMDRLISVGRF